jgi:hypothetical protein
MKQRGRWYLLLIMALTLALASMAQAGVVGHFTQVEGRVELLKGGNLPADLVKLQDGVAPGDVIRTKSMSRAQVKFVDDTTLTIAPESRVGIEEFMYDAPKGQRQAVLQVFRGLVHTLVSRVLKNEQPDFIMKTHTGTMGVRGTSWYTQIAPLYTDVYTENGKVCCRNIFREVKGEVCTGNLEFTRIGQGLPPTVAMHFDKEELIWLQQKLKTGAGKGPGDAAVLPPPGLNYLELYSRTLYSRTSGQPNYDNLWSGLYVPPQPAVFVFNESAFGYFMQFYPEGQFAPRLKTAEATSSFSFTFTQGEGGVSGSRTGIRPGDFSATFLAQGVASQPVYVYDGTFTATMQGRVFATGGGVLSGRMTMTITPSAFPTYDSVTSGTTSPLQANMPSFTVSGQVTIKPNGDLVFRTSNQVFNFSGVKVTGSGIWTQKPLAAVR